MTRKLTLSILGFLLAFNLLAKDRIPLNKHFAPLERSQEDAAYLKVVNPIVDGKQIERIYDLDQRLVRIVSKYYDDRKNLIKTICEDVDEEGIVYKVKEINTKQSACTIYYLKDGQIIGQFYGNEHEVIFGKRVIGEEEVITSINIFEPGFSRSMVNYQEFLRQNLQYPAEAKMKKQQGKVELALEILPDGSLGKIEVVNSKDVPQILQQEAIRVISLYQDGFRGAVDVDGNPVTKWLYLPITFKLG